ncbi:uracil-DNA glycosylase [Amycolatopsis mediterranei S699]|uniref:Type-4 uracil-DNA glycosylase n=3 Tax=Amycolatopsis mediterranei TaxID=33910 RepID=A0A0H3D7K3_AMYMU|nr:UdgX family uracil-DNA binding protein [Amycolatopsis mediterranei]ADJ46965.1 uracil-DNA glycosylase [Amycolatopsis mediterranei U32]AEK43777.1 uracil-DNA glycosylase [Amycolatopsis mediterranei S699]AFO78676.1 uracil-DNA glycosylase [Amycolatopsis mediterranei S699]AGT85804.1 uracil-DNA glycosylase [Amycolatopsis mediterranei RB]KDO04599.1 uracil-DNA glycosylase [Amycolatopsis mediterranei]
MPDSRGAEPPDTTDLDRLRSAASGCQACPLYQDATQTVFGEGTARAKVLVVGEQPGDKEDLAGEPFVGPAGKLLDRAFEEAGFDRRSLYVTNAVKHFKFKRDERGKRRIHQKPGRTEVVACRPWLLAELRSVRPELVLLLGATAAQSLLGPKFRLTAHRGEPLEPPEELAGLVPAAMATVHPSAVLRAPDRDEAYASFVADLQAAAKLLG